MHALPLVLAADVATLAGIPVDALVLQAGLAALAALVALDTRRRLKRKA